MTDWVASEDVVLADIVADVALDVVIDFTMFGPP